MSCSNIIQLLQIKWEIEKKRFWKKGGFGRPKVIVYILLFLWALRTFMREKCLLSKKSVRNQHIYITGAGSGLGRGMALKFAARKANLTLSDINEQGLLETKDMIQKATGTAQNVLTIKLDVSNREEIRSSAQKAKQEFGDVDILINNAGIVQGKTMMEMSENMMNKQFVINTECHFWLIREFLGPMMEKNKGQIVSIASAAGLLG